jgi:VanZ family protein
MHRANSEEKNWRAAVFFWFLTAGYMAAIFILSSFKGPDLPPLPVNIDKVVHTGVYIPLAFLFYLSLKKSGMRKYVFAVAFLSACMYGISDEFHQSFVPGRDAAVGDVIADFFGALIGCIGASFLKG